MSKKQYVDKDYSFESVKEKDKKGFISMFAVMLGFTFFSASMLTGGKLGVALSIKDFALAVFLGNLILAIYTGALAYIGADTGLSMHLLARYSFGEKGAYLPSLLTSFTQIGWFGVGVAMFVIPVSKITGINIYLLVAVSGLLMTSTAYFGMKSLTILSVIAVPAITLLGCASMFRAVNAIGGASQLLNIAPKGKMGLVTGVTLCVGSFISGGSTTPDFVRFAKNKKIAVTTTVVAFFIGNSLMFLFGAIGAMATGYSDISDVMISQGLIIPAILALGLNIWTTNDNAIYTSGLGISNITKVPKSKVVIFNGILGTIGALWLYNNFVSFLSLLGAMIPAVGGIIIADYFFVRKRKYESLKEANFKVINYKAIGACILGILAGKYLTIGIPSINSLIITGAIHIILEKAIKEKTQKNVQCDEYAA
ncbi:cytosine permease [Clostridium botulinum]|uniref:Cytosine permease n=1 Tax=Clostridium botulinum TaxID=1491 RepID=A0A6G4GZF2_CLOBO|nr:cytosine permease [Clostridium botulinum]MBY6839779.1 cytosine permease [Clostridium botulinum]NFH34679.1 cytosine permease [Clostridium botulinum]NFU26766.1 cytosine permease [Clostridium botulinum]NFV04775.1 cytosine permease [Clostridium botulinum]